MFPWLKAFFGMNLSPSDFTHLWKGQCGSSWAFKMVAVRGALEPVSVPNSLAVYDDVIFLIDETAGSVRALLASVDPAPSLVRKPINPKGAAQLKPGVHFFKRGLHHSDPYKPCLVQAEPFTVFRLDTAGNIKFEETGEFGIHFHSGGTCPGGTADLETWTTQNFSAGCLITHEQSYFGSDWLARMQSINATMNREGIIEVPLLLLEKSEFDLPIPTQFENPVTA